MYADSSVACFTLKAEFDSMTTWKKKKKAFKPVCA